MSAVQQFGHYLLNKKQRAYVIALVMSLVPLMGWLATVVVGLVTLRQGPRDGFIVMLFAVVVSFALIFLGYVQPIIFEFFGGAIFVWLTAVVLRTTSSWTSVLYAVCFFGSAVVIGIHLQNPAINLWWEAKYQALIAAQLQQSEGQNPFLLQMAQTIKDNPADLNRVCMVATGVLVSLAALIGICNLGIARYWQARLYNPAGFTRELYAIHVQHWVGVIYIILMVAGYLQSQLAMDLLPGFFVLFLLAGFSLAHALMSRKVQDKPEKKLFWYIGFYGLVFIGGPYALLLMSMLGLLDAFIDIRARYQS